MESRTLISVQEKREREAECRRMWQQIFGDTDSYLDYYHLHKWPDNIVLLLEEEEVCSMLHLNPYRICQEGRQSRLHYIVGVCTVERLRGRGCMGHLLTEALQQMYRRGEAWTYLMPVAAELYAPYGFVPVYQTVKRVVEWEEECRGTDRENGAERWDKKQGALGTVLSYGNASAEKREELIHFAHRRLLERFSVYTVHDEAYFDERAAEMCACGGDVLILEQEDKVAGYVQYMHDPDEHPAFEIVEFVSEEGMEQDNILLLGRYFEGGCTCFDETCFWPVSGGMAGEGMCEGVAALRRVTEEKRLVTMARPVCLEAFLRQVKRPTQWGECVCVEVRDDMIEQNNGVWRILFREGCSQENQVERGGGMPEFSYHVSRLAEIFFEGMPCYINELV